VPFSADVANRQLFLIGRAVNLLMLMAADVGGLAQLKTEQLLKAQMMDFICLSNKQSVISAG